MCHWSWTKFVLQLVNGIMYCDLQVGETCLQKGKILIINAIEKIRKEKNMSYLDPEHIKEISEAYDNWEDVEGFCNIVDIDEIKDNHSRLSVQLYVKMDQNDVDHYLLPDVLNKWILSSNKLHSSTSVLRCLKNSMTKGCLNE